MKKHAINKETITVVVKMMCVKYKEWDVTGRVVVMQIVGRIVHSVIQSVERDIVSVCNKHRVVLITVHVLLSGWTVVNSLFIVITCK